jgi:hypothetical protein
MAIPGTSEQTRLTAAAAAKELKMRRYLKDLLDGNKAAAALLSWAIVLTLGAVPAPAQDGFIRIPAVAAGLGPHYVAVGDFNGDGRQDIVVTNIYQTGRPFFDVLESDLHVFLGNGDGTFQASQTLTAGLGPDGVAVGDFNGDGIPDLAVANAGAFGILLGDNTVSIFLGKGDGTFKDQQKYEAGPRPGSVAVGDFNNDGIADLVTANTGSKSVTVLPGNGDGTFGAPQSYAVASVARSVAIGDFNRDGNLDLVTSGGSLLLGNGDGTFQAAQNNGASGDSVAVADFNRDGLLDLVVAGSSGVTVFLGNGDGSFQPGQVYAGSNPTSVAVADFNGDGITDLVVFNLGTFPDHLHTLSVLLGNGDGTFQAPQNFAAGPDSNFVAVGDFNGDSFPDLAVTSDISPGPGTVTILINGANW